MDIRNTTRENITSESGHQFPAGEVTTITDAVFDFISRENYIAHKLRSSQLTIEEAVTGRDAMRDQLKDMGILKKDTADLSDDELRALIDEQS